jgi:hypothetical protein
VKNTSRRWCPWTQDSWVQTRPRRWIFQGDKNPQHDSVWRGSKAPCNILRHVKIAYKYEQRYFDNQFIIHFVSPSCFVTRWLHWYDCQRDMLDESGVFPIDFIPPWFSVLIYHLEDKQYARWWPQFRDVVSPYRHDHHHQYLVNNTNMKLFIMQLSVAYCYLHSHKSSCFRQHVPSTLGIQIRLPQRWRCRLWWSGLWRRVVVHMVNVSSLHNGCRVACNEPLSMKQVKFETRRIFTYTAAHKLSRQTTFRRWYPKYLWR